MVEECLRSAPSSFILYTRDGEPYIHVEGYNANYGCNPDNPLYRDPYTGEMRKPTSLDAANMGKLIDYLPHIDFINTCNFAFDVPEDIADRVNIRQYMFNLRKPLCFSCKDASALEDIIEMGAIAAGGHDKLRIHPYLFHIEEPVSPLTHDEVAIDCVMTCAKHEVPLVYFPMTMAGATAPADACWASCAVARRDTLRPCDSPVHEPGRAVCLRGDTEHHGYADDEILLWSAGDVALRLRDSRYRSLLQTPDMGDGRTDRRGRDRPAVRS